ncbi:hypothetical protein LTR35_011935 [Friedmanniomyces endolithicus]|nr:hypothetical protein LTR35_011935 [Friedmanniomyces endolithicus]KAK0293330.1 hypothetical protein LTS00_007576 [Friedmanniomyces endolithicus]
MSFDSLRHGHQMSALEFLRDKPLPSVPSPTLTNPDMVLPAFDGDVPASLPSPPRTMRRTPSLNFFRDRMAEQQNARTQAPKKEKRGLMSRKMLLLRSRTSSGMTVNGGQQQQQQTAPRSVPSDSDTFSTYNSNYASSPTLMDVGNLAPEQVNEKRLSFGGSSFNSEDYAVIPAFLAKYEAIDGTTTDDEMFDSDSPAPKRYGYSVTIEGGLDAQRRQREEAEHKSAMLSSRAEQILANAKKRLNLMEGNLRGARDLVAPLTHANLKRATSLGSSHHTSYAGRGGFDGYGAESPVRQYPVRPLTAQASSPTMGRDYVGHARGFSGTELPERPQTAFSKSHSMTRSGRIPVKASDGSWTQSLRSSQSYDSLGSNGAHRERPLHAKGSPDSNLEPLAEDEASHRATSPRNSTGKDDRHNALRIQRPPSRTDDLREQMTSLKGRISTLRDRAREDSLRRQSLQNLRTPSPFSNSAASPPEYFYTQSPSYGSPVLDTNAGIGHVSADNSPETPQAPPETWDASHTVSGSRNAFAQQAAAQRWRSDDHVSPGRVAKSVVPRKPLPEAATPMQNQHKRTQSGTMMVQPAADRYAHHQSSRSHDLPGAYAQDEAEAPASPGAYAEEDSELSLPTAESITPGYDHTVSDAGDEENASVYQDAVAESPPVVAHEDRSDAFDYENFFLHSAMATYGNGSTGRRGSHSSAETTTSVATARGPAAELTEDHDFDFDPSSSLYPPPTPETPERLKEIERSLIHRRTLSDDSVSTFATFATADEGRLSPFDRSRQPSALDWPIPPSESIAPARPTSNSRPPSASRPITAIKRGPGSGVVAITAAAKHRSTSSERADSGVGLPKRANSGGCLSKTKQRTAGPTLASPPLSPRSSGAAPQNLQAYPHDPAKVVVNGLLNPLGKGLGLKDTAILFGLVENLRRVVAGLQQEGSGEGEFDARVLRVRLEEAAAVLEGEM